MAISRRGFVAGSALLGGAGAAQLLSGAPLAAAQTATLQDSVPPAFGPVTVSPSDPRFPQLVTAFNRRWVGSPGSVQLVGTTSQVLAAVAAAAQAGQRISVRGGGHCYANFVYNSSVQTVIDLSLMNKVYFDITRNAFAVEGGARLGDVYEALFRGYGVTLPGGHCPSVGVGGHVTGGGHGLLSRKFGMITDFISAVEIVVVDAYKNASVVIAERNGVNSDLWWAISGGGGGNFGVITKYWFRSPSATGANPGQLLPNPPSNVFIANVVVPWSSLSQTQFTNLVGNLGTFFQNNSSPSSPYAALSSVLTIPHVSSGSLSWITQVDATVPNAAQLIATYHSALTANTGISAAVPYRTIPWMAAEETINTATPLIETNATFRNAVKSAYLIKGFTPAQIASIYTNMTRSDYSNPLPALLQLGAMAGGMINSVAQSATPIAYRNSALLAFFNVYWTDPSGDAANIGWLRDLYGQIFASTGGVPVPNDAYQGCTINLPDPDTADPTINTSGVSWQTLYYGSNFPRLQQVKAKWDPTNFFQHPMSITAS
ncbi:hypothetical protein ABIA33_002947 [Streptacidiphilus sp. MAP12-16]|uniref:FAD-dependent oxidoreductase n=1 Tax=Streptacidiphilus sp. MAP12-16 TaxID=3156300 RepID=UPI003516BBB9